MANIKSNEKSHRQDEKARLLNHSFESRMKTLIKKAVTSKKEEDINEAYSCIDSALAKGVIKKNKANRLKSRLSRKVSSK